MTRNKIYSVKKRIGGKNKRTDEEIICSSLEFITILKKKNTLGDVLKEALVQLLSIGDSKDAFILIEDAFDFSLPEESGGKQYIFSGEGRYGNDLISLDQIMNSGAKEVIRKVKRLKEAVFTHHTAVLPFFNEKHNAAGVFWVEGCQGKFSHKQLKIYCKMAEEVIHDAFLHLTLNRFRRELSGAYYQFRTCYHDIISGLRKIVGTKDCYTSEHSDRVSFYAYRIGEELHLTPDRMERLGAAGMLHDIGKIGTSDHILLKNGRLTLEEFEEIKKHPVRGEEILCTIGLLKDMAPIVRHHHERVDGTGYPDGLKQDEIEIEARIIAVADAFDAMTSDRSYRSRMTAEEAGTRLLNGSGTQFDSNAVLIFTGLLVSDQNIITLSQKSPENI